MEHIIHQLHIGGGKVVKTVHHHSRNVSLKGKVNEVSVVGVYSVVDVVDVGVKQKDG